MAEALMLVCDVCGRPAEESVTIRAGRVNRMKDLCRSHLQELLAGTRTPRRGRKPTVAKASTAAPKRRGRPPGSKNKAKSGNGRRKKAQTASA